MTLTLLNILNRLTFLAADLGIMMPPGAAPGGDAPAGAALPADAVLNGVPMQEPIGIPMWTWLLWGALFVGVYFIMIRPQRKREKKMREMQSAITAGDNVVISGGMFGKVTDVGEDCFVIEFGTNRGIRIPVLKSDVLAIRSPKLTPPPREPEQS